MFPKLIVALKTLLKFFGSLVFAVVASSVMFVKVLMYFSQGDHRWGWVWERLIGWMFFVSYALCALLFWFSYSLVSGKIKISLRPVIAIVSVVLVSGCFYYLTAVQCFDNTTQAQQPYDVARDEVYAAFLEDIAGEPLLVQDDVTSVGRLGFGGLPMDQELRQADKEATEDYERRNIAAMPVDGRFKLDRAYVMIPHTTALTIMNRAPEACKPFGQHSTLVFLSPVGFNSDQTLAAIAPTVIFSICDGPNRGAGG